MEIYSKMVTLTWSKSVVLNNFGITTLLSEIEIDKQLNSPIFSYVLGLPDIFLGLIFMLFSNKLINTFLIQLNHFFIKKVIIIPSYL